MQLAVTLQWQSILLISQSGLLNDDKLAAAADTAILFV